MVASVFRLAAPVALLVLAGCREERAPSKRDSAPPPAALEPAARFYLTDSATITSGANIFTLARLWRGGVLVDTVDRGFGFSTIGPDSVVYRAVSNHRRGMEGDTVADVGAITLYARGVRTALDPRLTAFDVFSSPAVIDGVLYYWSTPPESSATHGLWARSYDVRTGTIDSLLLAPDSIFQDPRFRTDDVSLFPEPFRDGTAIVFAWDSAHVWRWSRP